MRRTPALLTLISGVGVFLYARLHSTSHTVALPDSVAESPRPAAGTLELVSLNLGHGRGTARSQFRVDAAGHLRNLQAVAGVLEREQVHVVALQEVDAPSWWSGNLDHLAQIRAALGSPGAAHGIHATAANLRYGTALLGSDGLTDVASHTFGASGPTPRKGFTIASTTLDGRELDVVSLHLDFALSTIRERQLTELAQVLAVRRRPTVLLGDFNMEPSALQPFLDAQSMRSIPPAITFPGTGGRIDHVVVTSELEIVDLHVLPDHVSDHLPVRASVRWRDRSFAAMSAGDALSAR